MPDCEMPEKEWNTLFSGKEKPLSLRAVSAGVERIELPSAVLETDVLPLYDTPKKENGDAYGIRTRECRRERAVC